MANYTILLIDYEPRSIERFRDPLLAAGYGIEIATDGISGIEAFHRLSPDMVLVEAMIPKKHGFEVCQELKRTPQGRKTPIIITTGVYKGRKYRTQALHIYGCDEYIEKPIAPEQLLEIVGKFLKPGPSGSPAKAPERGPSQSESGGGSAHHEASRSATRAVSPPQATLTPRTISDSDAEDEIIARLDAILPGSATARQSVSAGIHTSLATAVDPIALMPPDLESTPYDDVFAEMRAELNAELDALPDPSDLDLDAAVSQTFPDFIPSDQLASPSLLEALPIPGSELPLPEPELLILEAQIPTPGPEAAAEVATPRVPEAAPTAPAERPGHVVDFDTTRTRKNKKSKQSKARTQQAPQPAPIPPPQESLAPPAPARVATVAELTLPRGTVVESELDVPVARRGIPVWVWAVAGIVVVVGLYFIFSGGTPDRSVAGSPSTTPSTPKASAASAIPPAPPELAPRTPAPNASGPAIDVAEPPAPTVPSQQGPAPKKPVDRPNKPPVAAPALVAPNTARVEQPVAARIQPKQEPPAAAPAPTAAAPAAPAGLNDADAGVETLPDPAAAAPAGTPGAGALIPIDEADAMPVSLSRVAPVYSEQAKQLRLAGTVIMNVLINEKGGVDQAVLVIGVPGADLNEAAIRAVKTWTYRPATKNGVPVKVWKSEQIVFKR